MLHVHVLFVAPLRTGNVTQACADQHERRVPIREATHHPRASADLPVETFNSVVGADSRPVLIRERCVSKRPSRQLNPPPF